MCSSDLVQIVRFSNDEVELEVETEAPGLLVMSDVHAPGWKASVNDQPATLLRANYAFRAVFVPAGEHRVTFHYEPLAFQVGALLSGFALLVLVVGLPISWVAGRENASPPPTQMLPS